MSSESCGNLTGTTEVNELVRGAVADMGAFVDTWEVLLTDTLTNFSEVEPENVDPPTKPSVDFTGPGQLPNNDFSPGAINFSKPNSPTAPLITRPPVSFSQPPGDPSLLSIALPDPPDPVVQPDVGDPPSETAYTLPTAPDDDLPDVPTLRAITLPTVPTLPTRTFSETAPVIDFTAPGDTFSFLEEAYSSSTLDAVQTRIESMLDGELALPDTVWDSIWDRGRMNIDRVAADNIKAVERESSARGFTLWQGAMDARVDAARQQAVTEISQLTRDQSIERAKMQEDAVRYAVAQGVALEEVLINMHLQQQQRAFEVAKILLEVATTIFDANVRLFDSRLRKWQTQADIYTKELEGDRLQLEIYKTQLEGQRLVGELNQQDVEIYVSLLRGLETRITLYKAQLEGINLIIAGDKNRIEVYRARLEAYAEFVKTKIAEVEVYKGTIDGEVAKAQINESIAKTYETRISAWAAQGSQTIEEAKLNLDAQRLSVESFVGSVQKYGADINGAVAEMNAKVEEDKLRLGAAEAQVRADNITFQGELASKNLGLEYDKFAFTSDLESARFQLDVAIKKLEAELEQLKSEAQIRAALVSSAMTAVSYQASISSSGQASQGCSTTYNHSYTHSE